MPKQVGLVQRVVPAERLLDEALSVARSVIAGGPQTIRQTKALLNAMFQRTGDHPARISSRRIWPPDTVTKPAKDWPRSPKNGSRTGM